MATNRTTSSKTARPDWRLRSPDQSPRLEGLVVVAAAKEPHLAEVLDQDPPARPSPARDSRWAQLDLGLRHLDEVRAFEDLDERWIRAP